MREQINIKEQIKHYEEEAFFLLSKLISFPTVLENFTPSEKYPFGESNAQALKFLLEYANHDGFHTKNDDYFAGHIEFGQGEEILGILAHIDVVPVQKTEWDTNPFTLTIKDEKMFGRGVVDDKGPLVATYIAMKILKNLGFKPKKKVRLIAGCDEESGSRCLTHYFKKHELPHIGFSPDAEFPLIYGEKAHLQYDFLGEISTEEIIIEFDCGQRYNVVPSQASMTLKVDYEKEFLNFLQKHNYQGTIDNHKYIAYGVASHAMVPQNGINASFILFEFLNEVHPTPLSNFFITYLTFDPFGKKMGYDMYDDKMKELTSNVGVVKIDNGHIKIGMDCRVPREEHFEKMKLKIEEAAKTASLTVEILNFGGYHYVDPDGHLVKTLYQIYQDVTNDYDSKPLTIGGGTYAKFINNAVAFGPLMVGREDVCHIANEYMYIDDFLKTIEIYALAIYELTK